MFTATTCPEPNTAYTRSPSTTGLALARLCLSCTEGSVPSAASSNVHARAPLARLSASMRNLTSCPCAAPLPSDRSAGEASSPCPSRGPSWLGPLPTCDVTNTRSPHTIGDDTPTPCNRVFHAMFRVSLHDSGSRVSLDAPVPAGPRHCGQFSADAEAPSRETASVTASQVMRVAILMNPPEVCFSETLRFVSAESNCDAPESATPLDPCTMCA